MDTIKPICPEEIDKLPGVIAHFQTDRDFNHCYATNDEMKSLSDISSVCLNFASAIAKHGGLGNLNSIVTYADGEKFALFASHTQNSEPPGIRIFGVKVDQSIEIESLTTKIREII